MVRFVRSVASSALKASSLPATLGVAGLALMTFPHAVRAEGTNARAPRPGANGTVIHIGDSFVDAGLSAALRPKFAAEATRYLNFGKHSTYLGTWAFEENLENYYYDYRPALVLVTLGANEPAAPPETRARLVREIVKRLRGAPCVWISTPLWKGAPTGLNDMIRRESAPCRFFDSSAVAADMPRMKDGVHPDKQGGQMWADAFWRWLDENRDPSRGYWGIKDAPPEEHR